MNSMQIKDKLKNIAKEKNIEFNILLKFYAFDRFILRLSKSKYADNFIIKGGFLLSKFFGLENRSTMDIDSALNNFDLTKENIIKIINEIIKIDLNDNVIFEFNDITSIREEDEYGGFRVHLTFKLDNIKELLKFDIATGDPLTPSAITFNYNSLLGEEKIKIWAYNIETILAEKLESIFSKLETGSRMKDYYDVYLIYTLYWDKMNKNNLLNAIKNTFNYRNFNIDPLKVLAVIKNSLILKTRWKSYSRKHNYAKDITFEDTIKSINDIVNNLFLIKI